VNGEEKVPKVLDFKMKSLEGKEVALSKYQGKMILVVNVASR
jgi:glutathione peroxidase